MNDQEVTRVEAIMSGKPFALSVKVVIHNKAGQCLLLKRSLQSKGNPGKWEFPGGKVEAGEDFDTGLLREVAEETGLTISLQRVAGAAESELPTRKVAYLIMEGQFESGQVCLSGEHESYAWVAIQDLATMDLAEQFRSFVQAYMRARGQERAV
jgi:8-oxo-dGTP diphosphatase